MPKRLLIVGPGDIAERALPQLLAGYEVLALTRTPERAAQLAGTGISTRVGDLDQPESMGAVLEGADCMLHCAPPPSSEAAARRDDRMHTLLAALDHALQKTRGMVPRRVVYVSTSGVYGDCGGAWIDESQPLRPATGRAHRRVDAERALSAWCETRGAGMVCLRVPGIYAADRLPLERLRKGTPVLQREDDVFTNHIHADDLAAICVRALNESVPPGVYNASDDSELLMGDWMDLVADHHGLARPPRVARAEAASRIAAPMLSFMSESRRLVNTKLKRDMGYVLRYPTVNAGVLAARPSPLNERGKL